MNVHKQFSSETSAHYDSPPSRSSSLNDVVQYGTLGDADMEQFATSSSQYDAPPSVTPSSSSSQYSAPPTIVSTSQYSAPPDIGRKKYTPATSQYSAPPDLNMVGGSGPPAVAKPIAKGISMSGGGPPPPSSQSGGGKPPTSSSSSSHNGKHKGRSNNHKHSRSKK